MNATRMNSSQWLKDAIIYQVYPQSFQDSDGDGVGDFPGLTGRLDYIRSLGVDVIWLNPCFDSPFDDAGYDVRDFYKIAPRYGTEADCVRLIAEAHARGMRVILDLVAGHTSMDNAWFLAEAAAPRAG
jgi:maltose alpha-D-glucosyltransferase/alpha-amylase